MVFEKNHEFYENFDEKVKKCPKRIYIYVLGALAGALGDQKSHKIAKKFMKISWISRGGPGAPAAPPPRGEKILTVVVAK